MWEVRILKSINKSIEKLPIKIQNSFFVFAEELQQLGPYRNNWLNYGVLKGKKNIYHCHIKKGKPTYVVIWEVKDKKIKIMEVIYVGTHEKAKY